MWARAVIGAVVLAAGVGLLPGPAARGGTPPPPCDEPAWVGAWTASPQPETRGYLFTDQTLRAVLTPTISGSQVRVRFSNLFGPAPLRISAATVAGRVSGPQVAPPSALTFDGRPGVVIPSGAEVLSDPVDFEVTAFADLAVSFHLPEPAVAPTGHSDARQTSYWAGTGAGDRTRDADGAAFTAAAPVWFVVSGVEVLTTRRSHAVVALGDSITDGFGSTVDGNQRWPDHLARRLHAAGRPTAVLNAGISANRLLNDGVVWAAGPSGLSRLDRDALDQPGVTHLILLEGINDIGIPPPEVSAAEIIAGMQQVVDRAHARGVRVIGATLLPTRFGLHGEPLGTAKRAEVNHWIRTSGAFDAVVDFDRLMQAPGDPQSLRDDYDSGDDLHPNDAGYAAMAGAIDLATLAHPCEERRPSGCRTPPAAAGRCPAQRPTTP